MQRRPINANICEIGGSYYQTVLEHLPRVGDYIILNSILDLKSGHDYVHHYLVEYVIHQIHDQTESSKGGQFISVYVRTADLPKGLDWQDYPREPD